MSVQKLGALVLQPSDQLALAFLLVLQRLVPRSQLFENGLTGPLDTLSRQLDLGVVVLDLSFNLSQRSVGEHAGGALLVPSYAEVVRIAFAGLASAVGDAEPTTAVPAEDGALEVVVVGSLLLTVALAVKHVLDPLPGFIIDQGLVLALVLDSVVHDDALVIGRAEDAVQLTL